MCRSYLCLLLNVGGSHNFEKVEGNMAKVQHRNGGMIFEVERNGIHDVCLFRFSVLAMMYGFMMPAITSTFIQKYSMFLSSVLDHDVINVGLEKKLVLQTWQFLHL